MRPPASTSVYSSDYNIDNELNTYLSLALDHIEERIAEAEVAVDTISKLRKQRQPIKKLEYVDFDNVSEPKPGKLTRHIPSRGLTLEQWLTPAEPLEKLTVEFSESYEEKRAALTKALDLSHMQYDQPIIGMPDLGLARQLSWTIDKMWDVLMQHGGPSPTSGSYVDAYSWRGAYMSLVVNETISDETLINVWFNMSDKDADVDAMARMYFKHLDLAASLTFDHYGDVMLDVIVAMETDEYFKTKTLKTMKAEVGREAMILANKHRQKQRAKETMKIMKQKGLL